ncbi:DNA-binding response regulator [Streptomyces sp. BI20]|uniref:DNA-binding response regulator n=1 Tax=Streptomyces sp. BI20 TaxID=3403460 RepID=UPI003C7267AD
MPAEHRPRRSLRVLLTGPDAPALAVLLGLEPDLAPSVPPAHGPGTAGAVADGRPEVVLLDDAAELAAVRAADPEARVLLRVGSARPGPLAEALAAGAAGAVLRDVPAGELAEAIRRAAAGELVLDPPLRAPEPA